MIGTNRTIQLLRELAGGANPAQLNAYNQMGMGLSNDRATRIGQILGHIGADLTQDRSREIWWFVNAPQALGNMINEAAINIANKDIYNKLDAVSINGPGSRTLTLADKIAAERIGAIDGPSQRLKKGYSIKENEKGDKEIYKRRYEPGFVDALNIPAGLAINSGIGLMNPFGGQEGYKAAIESEEDPSKTANPILGRCQVHSW